MSSKDASILLKNMRKVYYVRGSKNNVVIKNLSLSIKKENLLLYLELMELEKLLFLKP